MNKTELIAKWTKEAADWAKAKNSESFNNKTKEMAYNREWQLLHCIAELKNLPELTVECDSSEQATEICPTCGYSKERRLLENTSCHNCPKS